jgi:hypothetical protein
VNLRAVVVHYHIFKNAGTSIDRALQDAFGTRWRSVEGNNATDVISPARFKEYLDAEPDIVAISSHLARPPLPDGYNGVPIVFLRHPIDRAVSVYEFTKHDPMQPQHRLARNLSFQEYVEWALGGGRGGVVIRDYQTIHLSSASYHKPNIYDARATDEHLTEALGLLQSLPAVGAVDLFAQSIADFSDLITKRITPVNLYMWYDNVSGRLDLTLTQRLERARAALGARLWQRLRDANRRDYRLYEYAVSRVRRDTVRAVWRTMRDF